MNKLLTGYLAVTLVCLLCCALPAPCFAQTEAGSSEVPLLAGMDVVILGDSNTWIGGDDNSDPKGWNYWLQRECQPRSLRSYARSGATWTNTRATRRDPAYYSEKLDDNNVMFNQIVRLIEATDSNRQAVPNLIFLSAGTNDAWFADRRPEEFSITAETALRRDVGELMALPPAKITSLAESVRYGIRLLLSRFPKARIVVLTPLQSIKVSDEMLQAVAGIIEQVAVGENCAVLRQDILCPVRADRERFNRQLTSDGTHTSPAGARANARAITSALPAILYKGFNTHQ